MTALHGACALGKLDMVKFLLQAGANKEAKTKVGETIWLKPYILLTFMHLYFRWVTLPFGWPWTWVTLRWPGCCVGPRLRSYLPVLVIRYDHHSSMPPSWKSYRSGLIKKPLLCGTGQRVFAPGCGQQPTRLGWGLVGFRSWQGCQRQGGGICTHKLTNRGFLFMLHCLFVKYTP